MVAGVLSARTIAARVRPISTNVPRPALHLGAHQRHPGTATVRGHRAPLEPEILAYFTTGGASNGPTEAVHLLIKRSNASATDSATSTTTGYACFCTAVASHGELNPLRVSEDAHHAQQRRAT